MTILHGQGCQGGGEGAHIELTLGADVEDTALVGKGAGQTHKDQGRGLGQGVCNGAHGAEGTVQHGGEGLDGIIPGHQHDGPLSQAVHFPHSPDKPLDLSSCASHLIFHQKADSYVFRVFQPIKYIHLLLDGKCCAEKYNQSGQLFTDSTRDALQVFGLLETAVHGKFHTATMKCMTDCIIAKIPVPLYMQVIREDPDLMMMSMQHICFLFLDNVANTDQLMLSSPRRSILVRLYQYCGERTFPVTVQIRKEELAQDLNMNLRTLYRHLDKLYESGILTARKGKICISHAQYLQIEDELFNQTP